MQIGGKVDKLRDFNLTLDDPRRCDEWSYRTRDGLTVEVRIEPDDLSFANYSGTFLHELDELCPGLLDDVVEPYEPPVHKKYAYSRVWSLPSTVSVRNLTKLLTGEQRARIPKRLIAQMMTAIDRKNDRNTAYAECELTGSVEVLCTVSRRQQVVARNQLSGMFMVERSRIRQLEVDTLAEARATLDFEGTR